MDDAIQMVVQALEDSGLREETIIAFTSDVRISEGKRNNNAIKNPFCFTAFRTVVKLCMVATIIPSEEIRTPYGRVELDLPLSSVIQNSNKRPSRNRKIHSTGRLKVLMFHSTYLGHFLQKIKSISSKMKKSIFLSD